MLEINEEQSFASLVKPQRGEGAEYSLVKTERLQRALSARGYGELPALTLQPQLDGAEPVAVVTGASISEFNPAKHQRTPTKCYYAPTGENHLLNTSAAVAMSLVERGRRVILHVGPSEYQRVSQLVMFHPHAEQIKVLTGNCAEISFIADVYRAAKNMSQMKPVSRLDLVLYESYAAGLEKPFIPLFEDSPQLAGQITGRRIEMFHNLFMTAFDLLSTRDQGEIRMIGLTALAGRRASGNLSTDTLHKVASSALLETFAYESAYFCEKPSFVLEVAPGMVDCGPYDNRDVRRAVAEEAQIDGFAFAPTVDPDDLASWPMIAIQDLAEITSFYLMAEEGEQMPSSMQRRYAHLACAGRSVEQLQQGLRKAHQPQLTDSFETKKTFPSYAYFPGTKWNGFPELRQGYVPLMLTPPGQLF